MKNARLCFATLAIVTALGSAQAIAAETFELRGEQLAETILGEALPLSEVYALPYSQEQKLGPNILVFPRVNHCFQNPTGHGAFQLEIEAAFDTDEALDPSESATVTIFLKDPNQEDWITGRTPPPVFSLAGVVPWPTNPSLVRAQLSIDANSEGSFQNYAVALYKVPNSPKTVCMDIRFSRGLGSVGLRSIRLVPVR